MDLLQSGLGGYAEYMGRLCGIQKNRTRRDMLKQCCGGFGSVALAGLLSDEAMADELLRRPSKVNPLELGPLAVRRPHFPPRAKRVIFLFMHGGPSQVDTFDYKPRLQKEHGKPLPFAKPRVQFAETGNLMGSPYKWKQHGESGAWVSEIFPETAKMVDELCIIKGLHGSNPAHGAALLKVQLAQLHAMLPATQRSNGRRAGRSEEGKGRCSRLRAGGRCSWPRAGGGAEDEARRHRCGGKTGGDEGGGRPSTVWAASKTISRSDRSRDLFNSEMQFQLI